MIFAASCRNSVHANTSRNGMDVRQSPRIAFVTKGNSIGMLGISVMNPDGSDVIQLTTEKFDMVPQWAPNGRMIAFLSRRDEDSKMLEKYNISMPQALYIMAGDGSGQKRIADLPVMTFSWSPNSESIAFISSTEGSENIGMDGMDGMDAAVIYIVDVHAKKITKLTATKGAVGGLSWSPAGDQIAYSKRVAERMPDVHIVNVDGSGDRNLTSGGGPHWSPDGKHILFGVRAEGGPAGKRAFYSIDVDGNNQTLLFEEAENVNLVGYSPDGTKILYSRYEKPVHDIFIMNADGSNKLILSKGMFRWINFPQFVEKGKEVSFAGKKDGNWDIFTVDIDGKNLKNLTKSPVAELHLSYFSG